jgi:hypothetical protein
MAGRVGSGRRVGRLRQHPNARTSPRTDAHAGLTRAGPSAQRTRAGPSACTRTRACAGGACREQQHSLT